MQKKLETGIVKKPGILENQAKLIYLSLGSNIGNRVNSLENAKFLLNSNNVNITKTSSYYETKSWPNDKFPKYLNIVIEANTNLDVNSLYILIKIIEKKLGRKKTKKNYPRPCDIDILDYNGKVQSINLNDEKIKIPHANLHKRNFVLIPLLEISKNWIHPSYNQNIAKLLSNINNNDLRTIKII